MESSWTPKDSPARLEYLTKLQYEASPKPSVEPTPEALEPIATL